MTANAIPVAAVANFKGGVGKSTTALMLAEGLAYYYGLKILVFDFDAQANLSQLLLTSGGVARDRNCNRGVSAVLDTFIPGSEKTVEDIGDAVDSVNATVLEELVERRKSDRDGGWISLLSAHPEMRFLEPYLEREPGHAWYEIGDAIIERVMAVTQYDRGVADLIIIDCPPHVSALCRAALKMSDFYVTPTLAETLSVWGVQQFTRWMGRREFRDWVGRMDVRFEQRQFVVPTRYVSSSSAHRQALQNLRLDWPDRFFSTPISHRPTLHRELPRDELNSFHSISSRYRGRLKGEVSALADDFVNFVGEFTTTIPQFSDLNWQRLSFKERSMLFD